jgi:hypothetical protein
MVSSPDEFSELKQFWETYCSIYAGKGVDVAQMWTDWAKSKRDSLKEWSAEGNFDGLCESGCAPLILAVTVASFRPLGAFERQWRLIVGNSRKRDQKVLALEKAATALEELQNSFAVAVVSTEQGSLQPEILQWLRQELTCPSDLATTWPKSAPAPHPATVIRALRLYASFLGMFEAIADESHVGTTDTLSRYFVSAYVKRSTGGFHDEDVSALISATLRNSYDETAHRVWRSRNYERIDQELSGLVELLFGIGVVTSPYT